MLLFLLGAAFVLSFTSVFAGDKNGVGLQKISLPSGPGSIEGLGDSFEPQLNTGTSSYSVKIAIPPGVAGLQPDVVLRYNSGGGNGPFGLAWTCSAGMAIQRQTEKGLPTYGASDRFTLDGEELVPLSDGSYRTENEGGFRRIRRDGTGWIVWDRRGTKYLLGSQATSLNPSRVVRPDRDAFEDTFKWCVDTVIDVHGNRIEYTYARFPDSPGDTYCTRIRYSIFGTNAQEVAFDFESRVDAFSSFLSGFEVRTGRRCHQIRVLSNGALIRRYRLSYTLPSDDPIEPVALNDTGLRFSLLRQVTQHDNRPGDANFLPPLRLGYTRFDAGQVTRGTFVSPAPRSLGDPNLALADLNCDGLPDFFFTNPENGLHSVVYNQGRHRFSSPTHFVAQPTGFTLDNGGSQLLDADGDGRIDLVQKAGAGHFVYFPNSTQPSAPDETRPAWGNERNFATPFPPFDLDDPSVRSLDLNGDKLVDYMRTTAGGFVYFYNRGDRWEEDGIVLFGEPRMGDISYADAIDFTDGGQSNVNVKLADLNGDRLLDLVRTHIFQNQLVVTFWPNRGRGAWGTRTVMTGTVDLGTIPIEDALLLDINGDGLADVVAVGYDRVSYWVNQGNNAFSRRFEVAATPEYIKGQTVLRQADINGNGSTDMIWENFDPAIGGRRISYVDFIGATRPNLLAVIDNGIGLRTEISYATSTDFYVAALKGANPWRTRLPFPVTVVARIAKRFGLDLDAVPGEDRYLTEFSYHDGYYDTFEKEFRGFAFARKVERGDDRLGSGIEVNSPSTITRFAFHTGVPDGVDNDGDNLTDEFDVISGYEEEALKGKVLWTETTLLTAEFDEVDNDGDGFVDESDEGAGSGYTAPDAVVFSREINTWALKTIHDSGTVQANTLQPFAVLNGQKVTFPFVDTLEKKTIDAVGTLHATNTFATGLGPVVVRTTRQVDFFGNTTRQDDFGVVSGGSLGLYDDERRTTTQYESKITALLWIIGLPTETSVTDENGNFVSKSRTYYDELSFGQIGARGLATSEEKFIGTSSVAFPDFSAHPGDPRVPGSASLTSTTKYDEFGNPTIVRDPAYAGPGTGHERAYGYDGTFHTYVETETIKVGNGSADLVASATYDKGGGVIRTSTDFNSNVSRYNYDSFFRLVGIVKPGDSDTAPTQVFEYRPGDSVRKLSYAYNATGDLTLGVSAASIVVSSVSVKSREQTGGGTFDITQITDGAGHKLGTIEEGENANQWVYKDVKRYTSRGTERDSYLPFFAGNLEFRAPPSDGDRVTHFYDAAGRATRTVNPPEATGGARKSIRTDYLPLKTVLFDEEDNDIASVHFNTPHVQYKDGLDRLVGVDEINKEAGTAVTYPTRYSYDLQDNLVKIVDSQANQKWMRYDGLKRMIFMHDPDRGVMTYTYDAASNLERTVDAKNQTIVMAYDGANRIRSEDYLDAANRAPDVTYFYDVAVTVPTGDGSNATSTHAKGKLVSVTDLSGGEILSYDARGRTTWKVKRVPNPQTGVIASYQSSFTYDALDRLIRLTYPDGDHVGYGYNARNLPENITGGPGGFIISNVDYKASGQIETTSYGNGVVTSYAYDPRLRLRSLQTVSQPSTLNSQLISFAYQFDAASNITRIDDNRATIAANDPRKNTQVFGYDSLYRLTSAQYPTLLSGSPGSITYAYDRIGNMLSQTSNITHTENGLSVTNLGTMSYGGSMGPNGRIGRNGNQPGPHALSEIRNPQSAIRNFPYDANGNMLTIDGLACTWDFKDRLIAVENDKMRAEYTYDYTDRRITKKVTPKSLSTLNPQLSTWVLYIDRTFEIRENGEPTKYVWNGETRVARVTTNLNATQRVQRFTLHPGWNVLALAVNLVDGASQLSAMPVQQVLRYNATTRDYHALSASESIPAGTLLRVLASAGGELVVRGTYPPPVPVNYPAGSNWVLNTRFTPIDIASALPANATLSYFDPAIQAWRTRLPGPVASASTAPANLSPGEAVFSVHPATFTLTPANSTLEVRYYHQDHLGSSSVITDSAGVLVSESSFYPFGHPRFEYEPRNSKEIYGFTQTERDRENGLNHLSKRQLASSVGRFNSTEPLLSNLPSDWLRNPQLLNSYSYARNNPIILVDPDGASAFAVAVGIAALMTAAAIEIYDFYEKADTYLERGRKGIDATKEAQRAVENGDPSVQDAFDSEMRQLDQMKQQLQKDQLPAVVSTGLTPAFRKNADALTIGLAIGDRVGEKLFGISNRDIQARNWFRGGMDNSKTPLGLDPILGGLFDPKTNTAYYINSKDGSVYRSAPNFEGPSTRIPDSAPPPESNQP